MAVALTIQNITSTCLLFRLSTLNWFWKCFYEKNAPNWVILSESCLVKIHWNEHDLQYMHLTFSLKVTLSRNDLLGTRKTHQYLRIKLFILSQQWHGKLLSSRCKCKYYLINIPSDVSHLSFFLYTTDPTKEAENLLSKLLTWYNDFPQLQLYRVSIDGPLKIRLVVELGAGQRTWHHGGGNLWQL